MKAAFITEPGPPSAIQYAELPEPTPGPTEILVSVAAVSVNPIDTYIRGGMIPMPLPSPFIVGCDFAGTVKACGSEVTRFKVGDRVWGSNQGLLGRQGTFAEVIAVDAAFAYPMPEEASAETMASIALVGITAHQGLVQRAQLQAGETLFVRGGAGGVGSTVIQMGKALGCQVIASAGTDERVEICRSAGAAIAFNHEAQDWPSSLQAHSPDGVDVFWETHREPDFTHAVGALAENGRMVLMAGRDAKPPFPVGPFYVKGCSLHGFAMFKAPAEKQQESAAAINEWVNQGTLKATIGKTLPLSETAAAHELQEANTLQSQRVLYGKIVLTP